MFALGHTGVIAQQLRRVGVQFVLRGVWQGDIARQVPGATGQELTGWPTR